MPELGNHSEFQNFSESQGTSQHISTGGSGVTWGCSQYDSLVGPHQL